MENLEITSSTALRVSLECSNALTLENSMEKSGMENGLMQMLAVFVNVAGKMLTFFTALCAQIFLMFEFHS